MGLAVPLRRALIGIVAKIKQKTRQIQLTRSLDTLTVVHALYGKLNIKRAKDTIDSGTPKE